MTANDNITGQSTADDKIVDKKHPAASPTGLTIADAHDLPKASGAVSFGNAPEKSSTGFLGGVTGYLKGGLEAAGGLITAPLTVKSAEELAHNQETFKGWITRPDQKIVEAYNDVKTTFQTGTSEQIGHMLGAGTVMGAALYAGGRGLKGESPISKIGGATDAALQRSEVAGAGAITDFSPQTLQINREVSGVSSMLKSATTPAGEPIGLGVESKIISQRPAIAPAQTAEQALAAPIRQVDLTATSGRTITGSVASDVHLTGTAPLRQAASAPPKLNITGALTEAPLSGNAANLEAGAAVPRQLVKLPIPEQAEGLAVKVPPKPATVPGLEVTVGRTAEVVPGTIEPMPLPKPHQLGAVTGRDLPIVNLDMEPGVAKPSTPASAAPREITDLSRPPLQAAEPGAGIVPRVEKLTPPADVLPPRAATVDIMPGPVAGELVGAAPAEVISPTGAAADTRIKVRTEHPADVQTERPTNLGGQPALEANEVKSFVRQVEDLKPVQAVEAEAPQFKAFNNNATAFTKELNVLADKLEPTLLDRRAFEQKFTALKDSARDAGTNSAQLADLQKTYDSMVKSIDRHIDTRQTTFADQSIASARAAGLSGDDIVASVSRDVTKTPVWKDTSAEAEASITRIGQEGATTSGTTRPPSPRAINERIEKVEAAYKRFAHPDENEPKLTPAQAYKELRSNITDLERTLGGPTPEILRLRQTLAGMANEQMSVELTAARTVMADTLKPVLPKLSGKATTAVERFETATREAATASTEVERQAAYRDVIANKKIITNELKKLTTSDEPIATGQQAAPAASKAKLTTDAPAASPLEGAATTGTAAKKALASVQRVSDLSESVGLTRETTRPIFNPEAGITRIEGPVQQPVVRQPAAAQAQTDGAVPLRPRVTKVTEQPVERGQTPPRPRVTEVTDQPIESGTPPLRPRVIADESALPRTNVVTDTAAGARVVEKPFTPQENIRITTDAEALVKKPEFKQVQPQVEAFTKQLDKISTESTPSFEDIRQLKQSYTDFIKSAAQIDRQAPELVRIQQNFNANLTSLTDQVAQREMAAMPKVPQQAAPAPEVIRTRAAEVVRETPSWQRQSEAAATGLKDLEGKIRVAGSDGNMSAELSRKSEPGTPQPAKGPSIADQVTGLQKDFTEFQKGTVQPTQVRDIGNRIVQLEKQVTLLKDDAITPKVRQELVKGITEFKQNFAAMAEDQASMQAAFARQALKSEIMQSGSAMPELQAAVQKDLVGTARQVVAEINDANPARAQVIRQSIEHVETATSQESALRVTRVGAEVPVRVEPQPAAVQTAPARQPVSARVGEDGQLPVRRAPEPLVGQPPAEPFSVEQTGRLSQNLEVIRRDPKFSQFERQIEGVKTQIQKVSTEPTFENVKALERSYKEFHDQAVKPGTETPQLKTFDNDIRQNISVLKDQLADTKIQEIRPAAPSAEVRPSQPINETPIRRAPEPLAGRPPAEPFSVEQNARLSQNLDAISRDPKFTQFERQIEGVKTQIQKVSVEPTIENVNALERSYKEFRDQAFKPATETAPLKAFDNDIRQNISVLKDQLAFSPIEEVRPAAPKAEVRPSQPIAEVPIRREIEPLTGPRPAEPFSTEQNARLSQNLDALSRDPKFTQFDRQIEGVRTQIQKVTAEPTIENVNALERSYKEFRDQAFKPGTETPLLKTFDNDIRQNVSVLKDQLSYTQIQEIRPVAPTAEVRPSQPAAGTPAETAPVEQRTPVAREPIAREARPAVEGEQRPVKLGEQIDRPVVREPAQQPAIEQVRARAQQVVTDSPSWQTQTSEVRSNVRAIESKLAEPAPEVRAVAEIKSPTSGRTVADQVKQLEQHFEQYQRTPSVPEVAQAIKQDLADLRGTLRSEPMRTPEVAAVRDELSAGLNKVTATVNSMAADEASLQATFARQAARARITSGDALVREAPVEGQPKSVSSPSLVRQFEQAENNLRNAPAQDIQARYSDLVKAGDSIVERVSQVDPRAGQAIRTAIEDSARASREAALIDAQREAGARLPSTPREPIAQVAERQVVESNTFKQNTEVVRNNVTALKEAVVDERTLPTLDRPARETLRTQVESLDKRFEEFARRPSDQVVAEAVRNDLKQIRETIKTIDQPEVSRALSSRLEEVTKSFTSMSAEQASVETALARQAVRSRVSEALPQEVVESRVEPAPRAASATPVAREPIAPPEERLVTPREATPTEKVLARFEDTVEKLRTATPEEIPARYTELKTAARDLDRRIQETVAPVDAQQAQLIRTGIEDAVRVSREAAYADAERASATIIDRPPSEPVLPVLERAPVDLVVERPATATPAAAALEREPVRLGPDPVEARPVVNRDVAATASDTLVSRRPIEGEGLEKPLMPVDTARERVYQTAQDLTAATTPSEVRDAGTAFRKAVIEYNEEITKQATPNVAPRPLEQSIQPVREAFAQERLLQATEAKAALPAELRVQADAVLYAETPKEYAAALKQFSNDLRDTAQNAVKTQGQVPPGLIEDAQRFILKAQDAMLARQMAAIGDGMFSPLKEFRYYHPRTVNTLKRAAAALLLTDVAYRTLNPGSADTQWVLKLMGSQPSPQAGNVPSERPAAPVRAAEQQRQSIDTRPVTAPAASAPGAPRADVAPATPVVQASAVVNQKPNERGLDAPTVVAQQPPVTARPLASPQPQLAQLQDAPSRQAVFASEREREAGSISSGLFGTYSKAFLQSTSGLRPDGRWSLGPGEPVVQASSQSVAPFRPASFRIASTGDDTQQMRPTNRTFGLTPAAKLDPLGLNRMNLSTANPYTGPDGRRFAGGGALSKNQKQAQPTYGRLSYLAASGDRLGVGQDKSRVEASEQATHEQGGGVTDPVQTATILSSAAIGQNAPTAQAANGQTNPDDEKTVSLTQIT